MSTTRRVGRLLPLAFLALLASCGGGSDSPTTPADPDGPDSSDPDNPVQEAAAPSLSSSTVAMLQPLDLGGLPEGRDDLVAELALPNASVADTVGDYTLPLLPLDGGGYRVWIPTHPSDGANGGSAELRVRGEGGFVTGPASLTLEALPPAPGAFNELLDSLQLLLDLRWAAAGTSASEALAADWQSELDGRLVPLALLQSIVDSPDNPADLRALAEGSAAFDPYFGTSGVDVGLLDSYTAAGGILGEISRALDDLRATASTSGGPSSTGAEPQVAGSLSAAQLHALMEEAWAAAREIDPNSATGTLLAGYGFGLGVAGVVAGPAGKVAAAGLGSALWAYQTYLDGTSKLLPREFVPGSLLFDLTIPQFEEDRPGPGAWSNVRVSAQSEGWMLDKTALDLFLQISGGSGAYANWAKGADAEAVIDVAGFIREQVYGKLAEQSGIVQIIPEVWADVDITDGEWSEGRLGPGDAIELVGGTNQYTPVRVGSRVLTVSTNPARFGDAAPVFYREEVEVKPIEVSILASTTTVQPNELVELQILVENALDDALSWTLSAGTWASGPERIGTGTWSAQVQMPGDPRAFPVEVTFTSTATGGARDTPGAPVRDDVVRLGSVTVIVDPPSKLLPAGESQRFEATVIGATDTGVTWTAEGPSGPVPIGSDGTFTAPEELGEYLVTATSVEDPSAEGFANVTVVGQCYYTISLGGEVFSGDEIGHGFGVPGQSIPTIAWTRSNGAGFMYPESLSPGVTGSVSSVFGFQVGDRVWVASADEPVTLDVIENAGDVLAGGVTGTVLTIVNGNEVPVPLTMEFRSLELLGGGECTPGS